MGCGCGKKNKVGLMGQIKTGLKAGAQIAGGMALKVDESTYLNRIERCNQCDNLNQSSRKCTICGCFIDIKAKYEGDLFKCPDGKW